MARQVQKKGDFMVGQEQCNVKGFGGMHIWHGNLVAGHIFALLASTTPKKGDSATPNDLLVTKEGACLHL